MENPDLTTKHTKDTKSYPVEAGFKPTPTIKSFVFFNFVVFVTFVVNALPFLWLRLCRARLICAGTFENGRYGLQKNMHI